MYYSCIKNMGSQKVVIIGAPKYPEYLSALEGLAKRFIRGRKAVGTAT